MTNVMLTRLGQTWWFVGAGAGVSAFLSNLLLRTAGMPSPESLAQWLVYFICMGGIWQGISVISWFALVLIAPSSKLLNPAKR